MTKENVTENYEEAIFAGGCFWCLQADFDKLPGVIETIAGYDGGQIKNPTYEQVCAGNTGYAEVLKVIYDPQKITYSEVTNFFLRHIDPTVKDAQFCDIGNQYRTGIFYLNALQKEQALRAVEIIKKHFEHIYTEIVPSTNFYSAENYHQKYYQKNALHYKLYREGSGREARLKEVWGDHDKKN